MLMLSSTKNLRTLHRVNIITRSVCENKPIFHANHIDHISYIDIQDALDISQNMKPYQKQQYFYSLGINLDNVYKYYNVLQIFEKQFPKNNIFKNYYESVMILHFIVQNVVSALNIVFAFIFKKL